MAAFQGDAVFPDFCFGLVVEPVGAGHFEAADCFAVGGTKAFAVVEADEEGFAVALGGAVALWP